MNQIQRFWPEIRTGGPGDASVVDGFVLVFFLDHEGCATPRTAIAALTEVLRGPAAGRLHFFVNDDGDCEPLPRDPGTFVATRLMSKAQAGEFVGIQLFDTDQHGYRWEARYEHDPNARDPKNEKSFILFRMDHGGFAELSPEHAGELTRKLAELLPYCYGYASPALAYGEFIEATRPVVARHPGFDIVNPVAVALDLDDRALGPYWLNVLGTRLATKLGGGPSLTSQLNGVASVTPAPKDGLLIRIGEVPDVGDVNRGHTLAVYRSVARVLEPVLIDPRVRYIPDENDLFSRDAQTAWHRRFLKP